jgi:hypothetical protein
MLGKVSEAGRRDFVDLSQFWFLDAPRAVRAWDEAIVPTRSMTLRSDDILAIARQVGQRGRRYDFAKTLTDFVCDELRGEGKDKSIVTVPDWPSNLPLDEAQTWTNDESLQAAMARLEKLSGHKCRVRFNVGAGTVLHWENFLPKGFAPLLVLDASGRHRSVYSHWFKGRGDLRYLHSPKKTFQNLTVHFMDKPSGQDAYRPKILNGRMNWNWRHIVRETDKVLKQIPQGEGSLVVHLKPAEHAIDIEKQLRRLQTGLKPLRPAIPGVSFLTWGRHTGSNEYRDAKHAIVTHVLRYPAPEIEALGREQWHSRLRTSSRTKTTNRPI